VALDGSRGNSFRFGHADRRRSFSTLPVEVNPRPLHERCETALTDLVSVAKVFLEAND